MEACELIGLEFTEYLEGKIRSMEVAASVRMNPPRVLIADVSTELTPDLTHSDASTQSESISAGVVKLPQIIKVKSLTEVLEDAELNTATRCTEDSATTSTEGDLKPSGSVLIQVEPAADVVIQIDDGDDSKQKWNTDKVVVLYPILKF